MCDKLEDLDFADKLALIYHKQEQIQAKTKTDKLKETAEQVALKINTTSFASVTIDSKDIEKVSFFTYLGSIVSQKEGTAEDIKTTRWLELHLECCQTFGNQKELDKGPN